MKTNNYLVRKILKLIYWAYNEFYSRQEWLDRFNNITSPTLRLIGLATVKQWCLDRFHLSPDEPNDE